MIQVMQHLVESSVILGIFIIIYRLVLHLQPIYKFNRVFLLFSLLISAIVPFIHITDFGSVGGDGNVAALGIMMKSVNVYTNEIKHIVEPVVTKNAYLQWIYLVGGVLLLIRLFYGLFKINGLSRGNFLTKDQGFSLANMSGRFNPFSFFHIIFINRSLYSDDDLKQIIAHEKAHIRFKHSLDVLFMEVLLITQWFNPFAWIARKLLKELHEFQADREVLNSGVSISQYKMLLLFQASGARLMPVNNFNESITKKRFSMMNNNKWKKNIILRIAFSIAILTSTGFLFAFDNVSLSGSDHFILNKKIATMPEYPGGEMKMRKFLANSIKYPVEAQKGNIQGEVYVQFTVNKNGEVEKAKVIKSVDENLDNEALRVINGLGKTKWTPGKDEIGNPMNVKLYLPIRFVLQGEDIPEIQYPDDEVKRDDEIGRVVVFVGYDKSRWNIDTHTLK